MKRFALPFIAFTLGLSVVGCGGNNNSGNNNHGSKDSLFNEINSKIDIAQKSLGGLASSSKEEQSFKYRAPNQGNLDEDKCFGYQVGDIPSYVNKQQQMLYIVAIVNYVRDHLLDKSYGTGFEYNTYYEGAGFMETIKSLNDPIRQYGGPTPILKLRYTSDQNSLTFESNWDYQSEFMKQNMEFWNMRILSRVKIIFDDEQKIKQIWVNYNFEGSLAFAVSTSLFDYESEYFYTFFVGNSNSNMVTFTDPNMIKDAVDKVNSGKATSNNLVFCSNSEAAKSKLSADATASDYVSYRRWINRLDDTSLDGYIDYSDSPDTKDQFDALYDEVYNKISGFKFLTSYKSVNPTKIDSLINDSANYAYWRSYFIYDDEKNTTYIPFLERKELVKYLGQLKDTVEGDIKSDLAVVINTPQASEKKYVGNYFIHGDDYYELVLSSIDTEYLFKDNLITFRCSNGFSYELQKNGTSLIRFNIVDGKANKLEFITYNYDFRVSLKSGENSLYLNSYDELVITEIDPDPSKHYQYVLTYDFEYLDIDDDFYVYPLKRSEDRRLSIRVRETTTSLIRVLNVYIKPERVNGVYDFSTLDSEEKVNLIGKLEQFAYEHCLTGVPLGYDYYDNFFSFKFSNYGNHNYLLQNTNFLKGVQACISRPSRYLANPSLDYFPGNCEVDYGASGVVPYNSTDVHSNVVNGLGLSIDGNRELAIEYFRNAVGELINEGRITQGTPSRPKEIQFTIACLEQDQGLAHYIADTICEVFNNREVCDGLVVLNIGVRASSDGYSLDDLHWPVLCESALIKETRTSTDIYDYLKELSYTFMTPASVGQYIQTIPTNNMLYDSLVYNEKLFTFDALLGALLGECEIVNGRLNG